MIIAGVFKQVNEETFKKLSTLIKKHSQKEITYFETSLVSIVVGKTSFTVDQGEVLKTIDSLLVGKVFRKDNYKEITEQEVEQQSKETNKSFVKNYWGNYIFINTNKENKTITILRDPIGQLPLFYTKLDSGEVLFSSEIEILYSMITIKPDFNWSYLSAYMLHSSITTNQTAFNGIYELPHGCQLFINELDEYMTTSVIWNPLDYCSGYKNSKQIQKDIINTTKNVIKSWTKNTEGVFLDFSGGTDSTGLLFLLKSVLKKKQLLKPVNVFHPNVSFSDERKHALAIADEVGLDLINFDKSKSLPFDPVIEQPRVKPNWPTSTLTHLKIREEMDALSKDYTNIVHMSGHGGDHIFMCPTPVESLCDYLLEKGGKGFYPKLKEISIMFRKPLFPILKKMFYCFFSYYFCSHYKRPSYLSIQYNKIPWFTNELFNREQQVTYHPFFYEKKTAKILPGKLKHIESIYKGLSSVKKDVRDNKTNPVFFPFFSQPLIELALSIPTYASFKNGYNRYHFRKAISRTFKTNAVWRRDKGETSGIMQIGLKKNEQHILELCLKGKALQTGSFNKELLHKSIKKTIYGQTDHQWPITNLISLEIFLKYWR